MFPPFVGNQTQPTCIAVLDANHYTMGLTNFSFVRYVGYSYENTNETTVYIWSTRLKQLSHCLSDVFEYFVRGSPGSGFTWQICLFLALTDIKACIPEINRDYKVFFHLFHTKKEHFWLSSLSLTMGVGYWWMVSLLDCSYHEQFDQTSPPKGWQVGGQWSYFIGRSWCFTQNQEEFNTWSYHLPTKLLFPNRRGCIVLIPIPDLPKNLLTSDEVCVILLPIPDMPKNLLFWDGGGIIS